LVPLEPRDEAVVGFYEVNLSEFSVKTINLSAIESAKLLQRLSDSDMATKPFWVGFDGTIQSMPEYRPTKEKSVDEKPSKPLDDNSLSDTGDKRPSQVRTERRPRSR
jgi:hypothetical protein